jgi:hypothetical protein
MAITQRILSTILKKEIHPFVVSSALYDRHVEDRLVVLTEVEKAFEVQYHHRLFLHVDMESHVVTYEVETLGISLQCGWGAGVSPTSGEDRGEKTGRTRSV